MTTRSVRSLLFGKPLETHEMAHEKLPKWKALAVFSSDALSSVAYATQEILIPLALVSAAATSWSLPISLAIVILLAIVSLSYIQTIRAYPNGGGAYTVVRDNLGVELGLITAAALLIDYVLTVSVSVAAGLEAIGSAFPLFYEHRIIFGFIAIGIVTLINLRGVKESGTIFALPTYAFILSIFTLLITGIFRISNGTLIPQVDLAHEHYPQLSMFLILRAFASGCTALTGVEAISNGVPAFRAPESQNARKTLLWMSVILGTCFLGISYLAHYLNIQPTHHETVISMIAGQVFGRNFFYYGVQISTALILFLAANTSFADFPRVCSLLARDKYMPRQFANFGDRLVFSNGIFALGLVSAFLLFLFNGTTHLLIPLYAVGVFLSFTLSQAGMVLRHWKVREKRWVLSLIANAVGALTTGVVLVVITSTKFIHGAWIVVVLIPLMVFWFSRVFVHYAWANRQLALKIQPDFSKPISHQVVLPVSGIHRGVIQAIRYSNSISHNVTAVYVNLNLENTQRFKQAWDNLNCGIPLVILESPYRSVVTPIIKYVKAINSGDMVTVVIPEFVTAKLYHNFYHNQTAFLIKAALLFEKGKVVTSIRYHLRK